MPLFVDVKETELQILFAVFSVQHSTVDPSGRLHLSLYVCLLMCKIFPIMNKQDGFKLFPMVWFSVALDVQQCNS